MKCSILETRYFETSAEEGADRDCRPFIFSFSQAFYFFFYKRVGIEQISRFLSDKFVRGGGVTMGEIVFRGQPVGALFQH